LACGLKATLFVLPFLAVGYNLTVVIAKLNVITVLTKIHFQTIADTGSSVPKIFFGFWPLQFE
jgi:hypothetical protein